MTRVVNRVAWLAVRSNLSCSAILLRVCVGRLAASVLLLSLVCWCADVERPAVGVEYVLAAVALVERFA